LRVLVVLDRRQGKKNVYVIIPVLLGYSQVARTNEIGQAEWNYKHLIELNNSPGNGNADIYWVEAGFIDKLKKSSE
jgi:hypothetical protein